MVCPVCREKPDAEELLDLGLIESVEVFADAKARKRAERRSHVDATTGQKKMPKEREDANGHLIFYYDDSESDEEDDEEDVTGEGGTGGEATPATGGVALAFSTRKGNVDFKEAFEELRQRFTGEGVLDAKNGAHYYKKSCRGIVYFKSSESAVAANVKIEFSGKKCVWDADDEWEVAYHFD